MSHKISYILVILTTCAVYIVTLVFNAYASGILQDKDLFHNKTGDISNYYYTDITPAGWTFSIWGVIYIWQALWLLYSISTICRTTGYGYIYLNPAHQPPRLYILYIFNLLTNIGWLFCWDRLQPAWGLVMLICNASLLYMCLAVSGVSLYNTTPLFIREHKKTDIWLTRILTQNGLAIYATWSTIAMILNLDVVLIYEANMEISLAGTVSLSLLFLSIILWFILQSFIFDRFFRFILTPYAVFIVALSGSLSKNWNSTSSNTVLTVCIMVVAALALVLKLVHLIYKQIKQPLFSSGSSSFYTRTPNSRTPSYGAIASEKEQLFEHSN